MTCNFTTFSTVFQSYQNDGMVIMKSFVQWNHIYDWKDFRLERVSNPKLLDQEARLNLPSYHSSHTCTFKASY